MSIFDNRAMVIYPQSIMVSADYDQYYASLAASAAPSAQATPAVPDLGSDFGDEEEDVKPSVEYLDSLNDYRKRSRSREDVGMGGGPVKTPRTNGHEPSPLSYTNGVDIPVEAEILVNGMTVEDVPADDPIVYGMYLLHYKART